MRIDAVRREDENSGETYAGIEGKFSEHPTLFATKFNILDDSGRLFEFDYSDYRYDIIEEDEVIENVETNPLAGWVNDAEQSALNTDNREKQSAQEQIKAIHNSMQPTVDLTGLRVEALRLAVESTLEPGIIETAAKYYQFLTSDIIGVDKH